MTVPELFGDPDQWPDDDLIAITGALSPHLVLAALHEGVFPMPVTDEEVPPGVPGGDSVVVSHVSRCSASRSSQGRSQFAQDNQAPDDDRRSRLWRRHRTMC